jgi:hypothetical protein
MADHVKPSDQPNVLVEPVTTLNGAALDATSYAQRVIIVRNPSDGLVNDHDPADGTYGYAAGTGSATVDVPALAKLRRVSVVANASTPTTVTIGGGNTITIVAGGSFDEQIPGLALDADVVIAGGASQSYYVSWVV